MKPGQYSIALLVVCAGMAAIVGSGCDTKISVAPPPSSLAVTAVLKPLDERQRLLLTRVRSSAVDGPLRLDEDELVQSAEVTVNGVPFETVPYDSMDPRPRDRYDSYNYFSDSLDVLPGATYELEVRHDGKLIRGRTTTPGAFGGSADGQRIYWSPSEGAARYRVEVSYDPPGQISPADRDNILEYIFFTADTSVTVPSGPNFIAGRYFIQIQAYDPNLSAFRLEPITRGGVEGAYGIFGAITGFHGFLELPAK